MTDKYILSRQTSIPCISLQAWGEWMEKANRHIGDKTKRGVRISTVFLGLDHNFSGNTPILFESLIFGGESDGYMQRYSTINKAREGHKQLVKRVIRETR